MSRIAVIGGTGLNAIAGAVRLISGTDTPYGAASAALQQGELGVHEVVFLARHGQPHRIAPHAINYRANVWLLKQAGVEAVIAVNAVGGIHPAFAPGVIVIPHQLIDYTWGRESTYSDATRLLHVDFTYPYDTAWRSRLAAAANAADVQRLYDFGVYACTQGPRLESAGEVERLARDGCDLVGMTAMPEAVLAREMALPYAAVCLVVNAAAGRGVGLITHSEIEAVIAGGMARVEALLARAIAAL